MADEEAVVSMARKGFAPIKKEYLDLNHKPRLAADYLPNSTVEQYRHLIEEPKSEEPPLKRQKITGRNKKRPFEKRLSPSERLCPSIAGERVCTYGDRCKFSHDVSKYLKSQGGTDANIHCYLFETFGKCPFGITCVFAGQHTDVNMKSIVCQELVEKFSGRTSIRNLLTKDMQIRLRKREYNFDRTNQILKKMNREFRANKGKPNNLKTNGSPEAVGTPIAIDSTAVSLAENVLLEAGDVGSSSTPIVEKDSEIASVLTPDSANAKCLEKISQSNLEDKVPIETASNKAVGCITDEDVIRLQRDEKKMIDFRGKLYLAPLTTVGNLPFRRICKKFGADITCGEMAVTSNLLQGQQSEWALIKRHESETVFGVQCDMKWRCCVCPSALKLCGSYPDMMTRTAQVLSENMQVDFIDINIGCPIDLVFQKGEGCALMSRMTRLEQIVKTVTSVTDIPLTFKMRTGIYEDHYVAHTLLPKLAQWNVAMATVHGRSREQRYTKLADWDYIKFCVEAAKPMPLFGNGDILSYMDYKRCIESSGVAGCMIARGALIKPWIFTEIKEQRDWDISATERFEIVKEFANYGLEHWGSDQQGVANTRRFLLEWLSFMHRYIPVGILERPPQRINERPPYYFGRNDLETLLSSPNCADWVKISEMLLGPVPSGFTFLPKHKANSYQ